MERNMQNDNNKFIKINKCFLLFILVMNLFFFPQNIHASEKDINIELDKDYNICQFNITFPDTRPYKVTISGNLSGNMVEAFNTEGEDTLTVTANDCKTGNYTVHIETVDGTDEIEIGTVSISVTASRDTVESIASEIKVARDIVGLSTYFIDDNVIVEWDDKTVGNVDVSIINTKTHEILYEETVGEIKRAEYQMPNNIKQVTVAVVPSESEGIEDAVKQVTLKLPARPSSSVAFDVLDYTNEESITAYYSVDDALGTKIYVNDNLVSSSTELPIGESEKEIPLEDGANHIVVYLVDAENNMFSFETDVEHDIIAPTLMVQNNYDGLNTYDETVTITGTVTDAKKLEINHAEVKINGDGTFSYTYVLHEGVNAVNITATDQAGNESTYEAAITKLIAEEPTGPTVQDILKYGIYAGIFLLAIVVFIVKYFQNKKKQEEIMRKKRLAMLKKKKLAMNTEIKNKRPNTPAKKHSQAKNAEDKQEGERYISSKKSVKRKNKKT